MPGTPPPVATVPRFTRTKRRLGKGRGFSVGELAQAGLQMCQARSFGIRVDRRRSTIHPHNVAALRAFLDASSQKTTTPQPNVETGPDEPKPEVDSVQGEKTSRRRLRGPAETRPS